MSRIAIILGRLVVGGATVDALQAAAHLQKDHEVLLITGSPEKGELDAQYLLPSGHSLTHIQIDGFHRKSMPWKHFQTCWKIKKILQSFRPDFVHTHTPMAGLLGRLAAAAAAVPRIVHTYHGFLFQGYFPAWKSKLVIAIERWLATKTNTIIALTAEQKEELVSKYKIAVASKVMVVPVTIELTPFLLDREAGRKKFRQYYQLQEQEIAIGMIGRLVAVKNHRFLVEVIAAMRNRYSHVRFFIIGDGALRPNLAYYATTLGIDHTYFPTEPRAAMLTFTGWDTAVETVMAGLDIVTLTSITEGTPICIMEAMASGKPVVSTDAGGVKDLVEEGKTGYVVAQGAVNDFCHHLSLLIENESLRKQMGMRAIEIAKARFSKQIEIESLRKIFSNGAKW